MNRAAGLVASAFERREPTDGSSIRAWRRQVATRLDCASNAVIAWCEGVSAPSLDSLRALAADPEFGPAFLTEIFADANIVCMSAEDAAIGHQGLTDDLLVVKDNALALARSIEHIPTAPTEVKWAGAKEAGEK